MRQLLDFKPPQPNRAIIGLCKLLHPFKLRFLEKLSIRFAEHSDQITSFLRNKPTVLLMNHPDRNDPLVLAGLSKHLNMDFHCVVAREVFDWNHGWLGWLFQKTGCYSVNRGVADIKSICTTKEILTRTNGKLVIFPEAKITCDRRYVHDVQRSLMHLLLETQLEMFKENKQKSLWLLPLAVNYEVESDLNTCVSKVLDTVERQLGMDSDQALDASARTIACIKVILRELSEVYRCESDKRTLLSQQAKSLLDQICKKIASYTGFQQDGSFSEQEIYSLRAAVSRSIEHESLLRESKGTCRSEREILDQFILDLDRVERLGILHRTLKQPTSHFQICRLVDFLELETVGKMSAKGSQSAVVCLGEPFDLLPYMTGYKNDKASATNQLEQHCKQVLQSTLDTARSN